MGNDPLIDSAAESDLATAAARRSAEHEAEMLSRTTVTPAPGSDVAPPMSSNGSTAFLHRFKQPDRGELSTAQAPIPGENMLRLVMTSLLSVICLLSVGGAILVLLLWQQDRSSGVLTTQLDRTWDLFATLAGIERIVAFAVIPVATIWTGLAAINVSRGTGIRRNPIAALSIPFGLAGIWVIGDRIIGPADDFVTGAAGVILQLIFAAVPLLALERIAQAAEARHRPLRSSYVIAAFYLAHLQGLGGLSTIEESSDPTTWGRLGAYMIIGALLLVLGTLSANEAARSIEDGAEHRYTLRKNFGESLLAQAAR